MSTPIIPLPAGQRAAIIVGLFVLLIAVAAIRGAAPALRQGYERYQKSAK